jgi:hypothetical protein
VKLSYLYLLDCKYGLNSLTISGVLSSNHFSTWRVTNPSFGMRSSLWSKILFSISHMIIKHLRILSRYQLGCQQTHHIGTLGSYTWLLLQCISPAPTLLSEQENCAYFRRFNIVLHPNDIYGVNLKSKRNTKTSNFVYK